MKYKQLILIAAGSLLLLAGCKSTQKPTLTAEQVIEKARLAISSTLTPEKLNNYILSGKVLILGSNNTRIKKNINLYHLKPNKYLFKVKSINKNPDGSMTKKTRKIYTDDKVIIWKTENEKNINIVDLSQDEAVKVNETIKEYKSIVTFSLFLSHFDMHLSNEPTSNYYKVSTKLEVSSPEGSNKYTYYINKENFHVMKIETEYGVAKNIKYKNINGINFPYRYKYVEAGPNPRKFYVEIEDVKYNIDIDKSIFLNPKSKNAKEI